MGVPGIEVATFFQQIFEPPVVPVRRRATEELLEAYKRQQLRPAAHPPPVSMG